MDILLYCQEPRHIRLFRPVVQHLQRLYPQHQLYACASEGVGREALVALGKSVMPRLGVLWLDQWEGRSFGAMVTASPVAEVFRGVSRVVDIGSGRLRAGIQYSSQAGFRNLADQVCVPGPWFAQRLGASVYVDLLLTGSAWDAGLRTSFDASAFRVQQGMAAHGPLILWRPCAPMEWSSLPLVWTKVRSLAAFGTLAIALDEDCPKETALALQERLATEKDLFFVPPGTDLMPYLRAADVLVSDCAEEMFAFAYLDKPLVLLDSALAKESTHYFEMELEQQFREACVCVQAPEELEAAVAECLANPGRLSLQRKRWAAQLFPGSDAPDAAEAIAHVIGMPMAEKPWSQSFDIIFPPHFGPREIEFCCANLQGFGWLVGPMLPGMPQPHPQYRAYQHESEIAGILQASASRYVLVYQRQAQLATDWRAPLLGPLHCRDAAPLVTGPVSTGKAGPLSQVISHIKIGKVVLPPNLDLGTLARIVRTSNAGEWNAVPLLDSPLLACLRTTLLSCGVSVFALQGPNGLRKALVSDALVRE